MARAKERLHRCRRVYLESRNLFTRIRLPDARWCESRSGNSCKCSAIRSCDYEPSRLLLPPAISSPPGARVIEGKCKTRTRDWRQNLIPFVLSLIQIENRREKRRTKVSEVLPSWAHGRHTLEQVLRQKRNLFALPRVRGEKTFVSFHRNYALVTKLWSDPVAARPFSRLPESRYFPPPRVHCTFWQTFVEEVERRFIASC